MARNKLLLVGLPVLLLAIMLPIFRAGAAALGREAGYLLGFACYWLVWCLVIPLALLGWKGFSALWQAQTPLFTRQNALAALLFLIITGVTLMMYSAEFSRAPLGLLLAAIPLAIFNGFCEEVLWRGVYVRAFPANPWMAVVYPSLGFAAWHVAPLQVYPAPGGIFPFVLSTFFLGLAYGFIAYRTRTARWTVLSHSLNGILALSGALAPALLALL